MSALRPYLEKWKHLKLAVKQHGGVIGAYLNFYRTDELKWGTVVGEDKYGNKYFQNKLYFMGRSRWVEFPASVGMDYDGSQIPAEWHRWMHYITDDPPTVVPPVSRSWILDHKENLTGTPQQYVPYSTCRPKITPWIPPQA